MNVNCNSTLLVSLFVALCVSFSKCDRIKQKIYKQIESNYFCFRRMNGTHQIGCNSNEGGSVGVLYIASNQSEVNYLANFGPNYPYVVAMSPKLFTTENIGLFKSVPKRISGVVVLHDDSVEQGYSPEKSCPNDNYGLYTYNSQYTQYAHCAKQEWNSNNPSLDLMFYDLPFPVFYIKNETSINDIRDCFERFRGPHWPLCAVQLISPMSAAKDSKTCMRRSNMQQNLIFAFNKSTYCDPLGGTNLFGTLLETQNNVTIDNKSIIVIASRMDSFSMFDNISPGADSAITSLITVLTVADTLKGIRDEIISEHTNKNVLFALFDGEAFDYIGSSRAVYDMTIMNAFPIDPAVQKPRIAQIRMNHLSHFIELNQIAIHKTESTPQLWMHKNVDVTEGVTKLEDIIEDESKAVVNLEISRIKNKAPLPPSSLQSFLKNNSDLIGVVIANHDHTYTNKYYNSLFDDIKNINNSNVNITKHIANIATVVSRSVYKLMTNRSNSVTANETLVEQLLTCYLTNAACDLFRQVSSPNMQMPTDNFSPYPTYVGVHQSNTPSSALRSYTYFLLAYLSGEGLDISKDECAQSNKENDLYHYIWMSGSSLNGTCVRSQAVHAAAVSPAFMSDDIDLSSSPYSTWTESQWRMSSARIFIKPSFTQQILTLIAGLLILCLSFVCVYFIDKKSLILFNQCDVGDVPQHSLTAGC